MSAEPSAFGVLYTSDPNAPPAPAKSVDELLTPDVKFVRITWVDFTNTVRFRVVPARYFRALFSNPQQSRPGIGLGIVSLGLVGLSTCPGFSAVGTYLYVPDLASWRVCTLSAPGHASVLGWFQEKVPNPTAGLTVPLCPRTILHRLVKCVFSPPGSIGFSYITSLRSARAPAVSVSLARCRRPAVSEMTHAIKRLFCGRRAISYREPLRILQSRRIY